MASEMESAALFIVGAYRRVRVGTVLLVVANQDSDSLTVLHINREKKRLEKTAIRADAVRPTCICKLWEDM